MKIDDTTSKVIKEVLEWVYCIAIAIILALLIRHYVGTPTIVKQVSMNPTLVQNQRLILNRIPITLGETPERGDIITFEAPSNSYATSLKANYDNEPDNILGKFSYYVLEVGKRSYIKRVIGLPGDSIKIENGKIYLNGEELKEDYLKSEVITKSSNSLLEDFTVPEGYIFAIGDNRGESMDCRAFGCIPLEKVESKVWIRFWPFDVFGKVR